MFCMCSVCSGDGERQSSATIRGLFTRVLPAPRDRPVSFSVYICVCKTVHECLRLSSPHIKGFLKQRNTELLRFLSVTNTIRRNIWINALTSSPLG